MQNKIFTQCFRDRSIGIEDGAEEATVGTAKLFAELPQHSQGEDGLARSFGGGFGLAHIRIPVEPREVTVSLLADRVERGTKTFPLRRARSQGLHDLLVNSRGVNSKERL